MVGLGLVPVCVVVQEAVSDGLGIVASQIQISLKRFLAAKGQTLV